MRLIDADALITELQKDEAQYDKEAEEAQNDPSSCTDGYSSAMWSRANGIRDAIIEIYDAPTIDAVSVVHGEWIEVDDVSISCRCSVCGWEAHLYEDDVYGMPYCPNCGAKMTEREGE